MRRHVLSLFALLLTFLAMAAFAQPASAPAFAQPDNDLETFRGDLLTYVSSLSALPPQLTSRFGADSASLERADATIRAMSVDDLRALKTQMDHIPYWQQLPSVLGAAVQQATANAASPRALGMAIGTAARFNDAEMIRQPLLGMVRSLRQIPAERVRPGYQQRVDNLEQMILGADEVQLVQASEAIKAHSAEWSLRLSRAMSADPAMRAMAVQKETLQDDCGSAFPAAIVCAINVIFNDVAAFFNALPGYATNAFNSVKNFILDFADDLPDNIAGLANTIGLTNINWTQVAQTALSYARLPCPPDNFLLPGFGHVGEIRTWKNFAGTVGFAGNAIKDLTPSDILTSLDLQAVTIVANFPIQWLSRCLENSWNDALQEAELDHQGLVQDNLDVVASTRATQTSVDLAQAQTNDTTVDVAHLETKLDNLNAVLNTVESTTNATIVTSDRLETTSIRLDTTATRVEGKVDNLQLQQGQANDLLEKMRTLWLRMSIEQDLNRQANFRISLFQLPSSVGGFLELAQSIVADTLQKRSAAGINVALATTDYNAGVAQYAAGNFKSAYSLFRKAYQRSVN